MACFDEEPDVSIHKSNLHRDVLPVWKNCGTIRSALLDEREDVVLIHSFSILQVYPV